MNVLGLVQNVLGGRDLVEDLFKDVVEDVFDLEHQLLHVLNYAERRKHERAKGTEPEKERKTTNLISVATSYNIRGKMSRK